MNRSYTNTYSSCSSFKLPNIIAMPESSAWPDIRRWGELHNNEDDFDEEDEGHLEAAVVVHNELYVSEGEEDGIHSAGSVEPDYNLQVASVVQEELVEEGDSDRQSHMSGISQQDRDNKTILLRQAASGISRI